MITSDLHATEQRRLRAESYLSHALGVDNRFQCRFYGECRATCSSKYLYVDQRPHIGDHYDLQVNGDDRRIVIVGQEYGTSDEFISVNERTNIIQGCGDYSFSDRNPHMRGTTSLLRLLLRKPLGKNHADEELGIGNAHLFQGFALVNALMCSAIDRDPADETGKGSAPGRASAAMFSNCSQHLKAMLEILDPTIIIVQGTNGRTVGAVSNAIGRRVYVGKQSFVLYNKSVEVIVVPHPSAPSYGWWGRSPRSNYLLEHIVPLFSDQF